jgi:tetratricopeptide (TPR) repeat protein
VLELDPTSAKAYENLGEDKLAAGELPAAIDDLRHAVDLDPRLFDALYNLTMALDAVGRRDEAQPLMERFVNEAPPLRYRADIEKIHALLATKK